MLLLLVTIISIKRPIIIKDFLSENEINNLFNEELPKKWYPSFVIDSSGQRKKNLERTSSQYEIQNMSLISQLTTKFQVWAKNTSIQFEEGSFVKYEPGQFFGLHGDASNIQNTNHFAKRSYTLLLCLQPATKGGETHFPYMNMQFPLNKGNALIWYNYDTNNHENEFFDHEALPVITGEKIMINAWFS